MIYTKISKNLYDRNTLKEAKREYPLYYDKLRAVERVINTELKTTLNKYPDIDIYISTERRKRTLGRFTNKPLRKYKRKDREHYIVLYIEKIIDFYTWHSVKGVKSVLYHEFIHFRQWLLNNELKHNKNLPTTARENANEGIILSLKQL